MVEKLSIFILGVTGYIGGTVLARLLTHRSADTFDITALVRSPEKAALLQCKFGVKTLIASHADYDKIEEAVAANHITLQISDSDDVPLTKAILRGLKKRHDTTGDLPILIHTSGTGVLIDDARGEYATETIYSDLNIDLLKSIPPDAYHRPVDLLVVSADEDGYARTHIVIPSTVYSIAAHPLVDAGISNPYSMQIPGLIGASLQRRSAAYVGKGLAIWPSVHIDDVADMYLILLDSILEHPDTTGHGWEGIYFSESGEHSWLDIGHALGRALHELGLADSPEPTPFSHEEILHYYKSEWHGYLYGTNSRARADRARALGWKPKYTTDDMLASIKPEVEAYVKKQSLA